MPIYLYKCENDHKFELIKKTIMKRHRRRRCKECGLYMHRDYQAESIKSGKEVHLDYEKDPISHLVKKDSFRGIMIENGSHNPVFIKDRQQYRKWLKDNHNIEKRTGIGGDNA